LIEVFDIHAAFISNYRIGVEWRWIKIRIDMYRMSKGRNRVSNQSRYKCDVKDNRIE
jgi:hypothetical protein